MTAEQERQDRARLCTHRALLRTAGERVQQLLRGVQRPDEARDEDGFAVDVDDGGETGPVGETPTRLLLKDVARYQQTLNFLSVKLRGQRSEVI